jgi:hypothetical protein
MKIKRKSEKKRKKRKKAEKSEKKRKKRTNGLEFRFALFRFEAKFQAAFFCVNSRQRLVNRFG